MAIIKPAGNLYNIKKWYGTGKNGELYVMEKWYDADGTPQYNYRLLESKRVLDTQDKHPERRYSNI